MKEVEKKNIKCSLLSSNPLSFKYNNKKHQNNCLYKVSLVLDPIVFVVSDVRFCIAVLIWLSSCLLLSEIFYTPVC